MQADTLSLQAAGASAQTPGPARPTSAAVLAHPQSQSHSHTHSQPRSSSSSSSSSPLSSSTQTSQQATWLRLAARNEAARAYNQQLQLRRQRQRQQHEQQYQHRHQHPYQHHLRHPTVSVVPPDDATGAPGRESSSSSLSSSSSSSSSSPGIVMQRVSALLPSWDRRKSASGGPGGGSGSGGGSGGHGKSMSIDRILSLGTALTGSGISSRRSSNTPAGSGKIQKETFWPGTLDKECDKAASILKSFCSDGCLAPVLQQDETTSRAAAPAPAPPTTPVHMTQKIPSRILQNAAAIAVFTCMRSGLWMTGSGGSGILIARKADGTWSPPSGIMLHTPTLSFIIGVDIYDCVLIVNNMSALESLTRSRVTLGEDVGLTSGPLVSLQSSEVDISWKDLGNTVFTYLKSRGRTQNVNLNGCILTERANENERFYGGNVGAMDVLAGNVSKHVDETKPLFEVIKAAEGRTDFDRAVIDRIAAQPAPGDAVIESPASTPVSPRAFGIPDADDPDPYGVLALEMAGLEIREAGSRPRPTSSQLDLTSNPSPVQSRFNRQSTDTVFSRSNRGSYLSNRTSRSQMTDACTQTDVAKTAKAAEAAETAPSPAQSEDGGGRTSLDNLASLREVDEVDYTKIDLTPLRQLSNPLSLDGDTVVDSPASAPSERNCGETDAKLASSDSAAAAPAKAAAPCAESEDNDADDEDDEDEEGEDGDEEEESVVVYEVAAAVQPAKATAASSRAIHAKGALVTIKRPPPPPLPLKSPARGSRGSRGMPTALDSYLNELELEPKTPELTSGPSENASVRTAEAPKGPGEAGEADKTASSDAEAAKLSRTLKHSSSVYTSAVGDRWSVDSARGGIPAYEDLAKELAKEYADEAPTSRHGEGGNGAEVFDRLDDRAPAARADAMIGQAVPA